VLSPSRSRPLVLVADDDEDILELVRLRLSRSGYDVLVAHDGDEAAALTSSHLPDLALLDVSMPRIDGYELTRRLREAAETSSIPVILLTARAQPEDVARGFAAGADDYITKPFSPELLAGRVATALSAATPHEPALPLLRSVGE
jgi:DNA-binding response OmpR family regulator